MKLLSKFVKVLKPRRFREMIAEYECKQILDVLSKHSIVAKRKIAHTVPFRAAFLLTDRKRLARTPTSLSPVRKGSYGFGCVALNVPL
jgi:hypothetical protein